MVELGLVVDGVDGRLEASALVQDGVRGGAHVVPEDLVGLVGTHGSPVKIFSKDLREALEEVGLLLQVVDLHVLHLLELLDVPVKRGDAARDVLDLVDGLRIPDEFAKLL